MRERGSPPSAPRGRWRWTRRTIRRGLLLGGFLLSGSAIVARAAQLQIVEHDRWRAAAEDQHRERLELPPRRGMILDRNGVALAMSHEMYQVSIAPRELRDPDAVVEALVETLGIARARAREAVSANRSWVVLPGRYTTEQQEALGHFRGVYFERRFERLYPQGDIGREIVGAVTRDGRALGGIEQELDAYLAGEPGYTILRRDAFGEAMPAISLPVEPPTDGAVVQLTIDFSLQEIADAALVEAMENTGASGGDLLIGDPRTGEILAAVSRRTGRRTRTLTAITEPYEPGSTLKPFLVATLLEEGVASIADSIYAEQGAWRDGSRTIRDTSPHEWLTLAEALEVSSNIAFAKLARRLSPGQQYAYLRDFGLGTLTGIEYPSESSGMLRRPADWSRLSAASLAMGYELSVTPLQMLAAYSALANGGLLMEPYLVREVRSADGRVIESRTPRRVRQVVREEVAETITNLLTAVVNEGTGSRASLATFAVAGKTGTSRRTANGGGYVAGSYTATFAGYFPAADPRIVIFVKLDEPRGDYYGGLTAAPVTRETLQGMLAARSVAIDGATLLTARSTSVAAPVLPMAPQPLASVMNVEARVSDVPHLLHLVADEVDAAGVGIGTLDGAQPDVHAEVLDSVVVPNTTGASLRTAARSVHGAGLKARVEGSGTIIDSDPAAGTLVARGSLVTLFAEAP